MKMKNGHYQLTKEIQPRLSGQPPLKEGSWWRIEKFGDGLSVSPASEASLYQDKYMPPMFLDTKEHAYPGISRWLVRRKNWKMEDIFPDTRS